MFAPTFSFLLTEMLPYVCPQRLLVAKEGANGT